MRLLSTPGVNTRDRSKLNRSELFSLAVFIVACGGGTAGDAASASADQVSAMAEPAGVSPSSCALPAGGYDDRCNACLVAECCSSIRACEQDEGCAAQLSCVVQCQNAADPTACSDACLADAPYPSYSAYDDCSFDRCRSTCWM